MESFESYWNKNFKEFEDNLTHLFNCDFREILKLKRLHDKEIKYITEINDTNVNNFHKDILEKDKQIAELKKWKETALSKEEVQKVQDKKIAELQAENEKLKSEIIILENKGILKKSDILNKKYPIYEYERK